MGNEIEMPEEPERKLTPEEWHQKDIEKISQNPENKQYFPIASKNPPETEESIKNRDGLHESLGTSTAELNKTTQESLDTKAAEEHAKQVAVYTSLGFDEGQAKAFINSMNDPGNEVARDNSKIDSESLASIANKDFNQSQSVDQVQAQGKEQSQESVQKQDAVQEQAPAQKSADVDTSTLDFSMDEPASDASQKDASTEVDSPEHRAMVLEAARQQQQAEQEQARNKEKDIGEWSL